MKKNKNNPIQRGLFYLKAICLESHLRYLAIYLMYCLKMGIPLIKLS